MSGTRLWYYITLYTYLFIFLARETIIPNCNISIGRRSLQKILRLGLVLGLVLKNPQLLK